MSEINIKHFNETHIKVGCDDSIAAELKDHFTFYVDGYKFHPLYRDKMWDGRLSFFKLGSRTLYKGLLKQLLTFCKDNSYTFTCDKELFNKADITYDEISDIITNHIEYKNNYTPRDYQIRSVYQCLKYRRRIIESATGSGKSLIQATLIKFLLADDDYTNDKKIVVIVPSVNLVNQMYSDFQDYFGDEFVGNVHRIYSGKEKITNKKIIVSTWQSLANITNQKFYDNIFAVLLDECHIVAHNSTNIKIIIKLLEKMKNTSRRFGFTGTIKKGATNALTLMGLFGDFFIANKTHELIANKTLSDLKIHCVVAKYSDDVRRNLFKTQYQDEIKFIESYKPRNDLIIKLTKGLKGNTIILCSHVENHGKVLFNRIKNELKDRPVFFVSGATSDVDRENIRKIIDKYDNAILVGSYQCLSTGVNAPSLSNLIFGSPSKSDSRVRQSIGRILRKHKEKTIATVFDIVDDFRIDDHKNYLWNHFIERINTYNEQKFTMKIHKVSI